MMRLDVEGLTNTFKLSEGALEQLDGELSVVEERFLVTVLGRRLLHSPSPTSSDGGFGHRHPPFISASTAVGSSTPSPPSLGDRRFVVVNCEEEEVKKKMISLWKKQGRATGRGSYIDKTRNRSGTSTTTHYFIMLVRATLLRIGLHFGRKTTRRLSITREGEGAGQ
jgi:hypothetical protein